ncbi:hypothetical protein TPHA_0A02020 [Tetrapisispora phaffii CBS 4417]|uniref:Ribosomal RNA-processing protein 8 n=1 Tax=Tetrapisispora phaffii (strain ATCC 24235 / CBS 4417 / NBRC 1672 / NRRL Y-8282 / UCD 70-5) TaxID=1071381 RepID=G8BN06_TETPH|nr:hypothetical protein TPHA_0A02020 [Tetrapisispora phaffii CBS 4417]CCE61284.1 hypothetical protein TPHA_0A02020 [Tetrapisispora phaffii CBS 4417]
MSLFAVDGWDIKSSKVIYDKANRKELTEEQEEKKKIRKDKKKLNKQKKRLLQQGKNVDTELNNKKDEEQKEEQEQEKEPKQEEHAVKQDLKKANNSQKRKHDELNESEVTEGNNPSNMQPITPIKKLTPLQQKMMAKLTGSRFRWINEQLYTIQSDDALKLIEEQPQIFDEYHDGFRSQVQAWPENPVDVMVNEIRVRSQKPVNAPGGLPGLKDKTIVIADMGCGEAKLALDVDNYFKGINQKAKKPFFKRKHKVHSFDLKRVNERITVADIKNVPLPDESCSIVIFCLALMGTNFLDFIKEAYRLLTPRGELWISEIKSRFNDKDGSGDEFVNALKLMGFFHKTTDVGNKMFTRFEFFKPAQDIIEERIAKLERRQKFIEVETEKEELEKKRTKIAEGKWLLKPCIYKRR